MRAAEGSRNVAASATVGKSVACKEAQRMTYTLGISKLLQLRQQYGDQMALDWLSVNMLLQYQPGIVSTEQLMQAWGVGQSTASRRITALAAAGLLDVSRGCCGYAVHDLDTASDGV